MEELMWNSEGKAVPVPSKQKGENNMNAMVTPVPRRLPSGRWLLTVAAAIGLLILIIAYVWKGPEYSISKDAIVGILSGVFTHYFLKSKKSGE